MTKRTSAQLTRRQLVSMCASLRGELDNLLRLCKSGRMITTAEPGSETALGVQDSIEDAERTMELSEFVPAQQDLLPSTDGLADGTYDESWMGDEPSPAVDYEAQAQELEARVWRERRALIGLRGKAKELAGVLRRGGAVDPGILIEGLAQASTSDLVAWFERARLHEKMTGVPGKRPAPWGAKGEQCPSTWKGERCTLRLDENGVHYGDHAGPEHWWAGDGDWTPPVEPAKEPHCRYCGGPCRFPAVPIDPGFGHYFGG